MRRARCVSTTSSSGSSDVVKWATKSSSRGSACPRLEAATTDPPSDERERKLRRGVGVGDRAADRAAVAGHEVPDVRKRLGERRALRTSARRRPGGLRRADPDAAVVRRSRRGRERVEVDQERRTASRRFSAARGSGRRRAPSPRRRLGERRRAPRRALVAATYANGAGFTVARSSQTRGGVNGSATSSRPSASATALASAAGALIELLSPIPLAPSGGERRGGLAMGDRQPGDPERWGRGSP